MCRHPVLKLRVLGMTLAALAVAASLPAWGASVIMMKDADLAASADLVVVAHSLGTVPAPDPEMTVTDYQMAVERVLKGTPDDAVIRVRVPGGVSSTGALSKVWGAPEFADGEELILFLNRTGDGVYGPAQLVLGGFHKKSVQGLAVAVRDLSEVDILNEASPEAKQEQQQVRDFERFANWLAGLGAGHAPTAQDYLFHAEKETMPVPMYTLINGSRNRLRWFDFGEGKPVLWRMTPGPFPGSTTSGHLMLRTALNAWDAAPLSVIKYRFAGTAIAMAGHSRADGKNVVLFNDPRNDIPGRYDCQRGGTVATGGITNAQGTGNFAGKTYYRINEADVVVQDGVGCIFKNNKNPDLLIQEVLAHELGHTLGLGHSSENPAEIRPRLHNALMYYSLDHNSMRGAGLRLDDILGAHTLYHLGF